MLGDTKMLDIIEHVQFLYDICFEVDAKVILEFGVREGTSTKVFLMAAPELNARVISVDIEDCSKIVESPYWEFHQMNDLDYEIDKPIDVLFIDTSHTYDQTLAELRKFAPLVAKTGVILLHDTEHCPEVKQAIYTFLNEVPNVYDFENRPNCNGLGILWRRQLQ